MAFGQLDGCEMGLTLESEEGEAGAAPALAKAGVGGHASDGHHENKEMQKVISIR